MEKSNSINYWKYYLLLLLLLAITFNVGIFSNSLKYTSNTEVSLDKKTELFDLKNSGPQINITTPENKTYTEPMSGYYPATWGFENDEGGSDPSEWTINEGGGPLQIIESLADHNKVVEIYDNTDSDESFLYSSFSEQLYGSVEFWACSNDVTKAAIFSLKNNSATNYDGPSSFCVALDADRIRYVDGTGWHTTSKVVLDNVWYHIKIAFECTLGAYLGLSQWTWRFYVNGEQFGDFPFQENVTPEKTFYYTYWQDSSYYIYLDSIGYSWDPNYHIGDNSYNGLLVSFEESITTEWIGYSLDGQANRTILGNTTISMPENGLHSIQVYSNDSLGDMYESDIRYFTIDYNPIKIITPENKTYTEPMSGYYPATWGFESDEVGANPEGWTVDTAFGIGGTAEVVSEKYGHKKVVEFDDTSDPPIGIYSSTFSNQATGTVEYWFYPEAMPSGLGFNFILYDGTTQIVNFYFWNTGSDYKFRVYDGVHHDVQTGCSLGKWYHIRIDFDCSGDSSTIYIDGINKGSWGLIGTPTQVNKMLLQTWGTTGSGQKVYIDAIGYSWDPDYTIEDNLNEGLLLSFDTGFTSDWLGYSFDDQNNRTVLGNTTIPIPADGLHTIQVFGNDTFGTMYQSDVRYFEIDTSPPVILIKTPSSDDFFGITAPDFDISINEPHLNTTWYTLNNGITNITFSGLIGTINQSQWNNRVDGFVYITFYANDTWGFEGYTSITVRKDIEAPVSSISFTPYRDLDIVIKSTVFTITADDGLGSGISLIRYKINDSSWFDYLGPFTLSNYDYGDYLITYQAIDGVGNIESENTTTVILIPESSQPGIPGYQFFVMIGVISIVSAILIKKKYK